MRYYAEEALGLVETLGLVPALEAADKMLKAADVELISYENVGSTLVTIMVRAMWPLCVPLSRPAPQPQPRSESCQQRM